MPNNPTRLILLDIATKAIPKFFAILMFCLGMWFLYSLHRPMNPPDIKIIRDILPLSLVEASHIGEIIVATLMLLLARGLWERIDAAYYIALSLFIVGGILAIARSLDVFAAGILFACALLILPCKTAFVRKSKLMELSFSPIWIFITLAAIGAAIWASSYAYVRIPLTKEILERFAYDDDTPRFVRGLPAVAVTMIAIGLWRMLGIARARPDLPDDEEMQKLSSLVQHADDGQNWLALMGDKYIFWHPNEKAFLAYGVSGRNYIVMGEPFGNEKEIEETCLNFKEFVGINRGKLGFYSVSVSKLPLMIDLGLSLFKIGEEAMVDLSEFTLAGKKNYGFRATLKKYDEMGAKFCVLSKEEAQLNIQKLRQISNQWLANKGTKERGFSLGSFDSEYIQKFPIAVVKLNGDIFAFANLLSSDNPKTLGIDLMRYGENAPPQCMEYLFLKLIEYAKCEGYEYFSLGLAPLSGLEPTKIAPAWAKIGNLIYHLGAEFYNFQGLRAYKQKFHPQWSPRYVAIEGRDTSLLSALLAVVNLGSKGKNNEV
ncbi:MAG: bifunctional lysylphosphatidylglycerol flippase/synthetase MprF [Caulobacterales bacterium]|nr:bifunctional lysylphosphatidylglycerol flippase/synthetase MprF [Caulobacterales bacterium]MCA0372623.1 phosphatidylglycerol lysyltransferase domain-containing protein [Pseudomonadota bacterium]